MGQAAAQVPGRIGRSVPKGDVVSLDDHRLAKRRQEDDERWNAIMGGVLGPAGYKVLCGDCAVMGEVTEERGSVQVTCPNCRRPLLEIAP